LARQPAPALVVAVPFDLAAVGATLGGEAVKARWSMAGRGDLTDLTWAPELDALVVLADKKDRLVIVRASGQIQGEVAVPGRQQEGVAFGPDGSLWIADDQDKCVLRIDGAVAAIQAALRPPAKQKAPAASLVGCNLLLESAVMMRRLPCVGLVLLAAAAAAAD